MPKVIFICGDEYYAADCEKGVTVAEAAALAGLALFAPCGGKGKCGGCAVRVRGEVSAPTERERELLGGDALYGERLACAAKILGDCTVFAASQRIYAPQNAGAETTAVSPFTGSKKCFAAAVDIGTTAVEMRAYSLPGGKLVRRKVFANPQARFGADVVSRLEACINGRQRELTSLINGAIEKTFAEWEIAPEFCVITGNTAMLHIAAGRDARGLANAPFTPETLFGEWHGSRYYMRCAGAYVGGDVTASLLAAEIKDVPTVLADIGTNNETVLFDGENFAACASAAGPAFEGAHISCGMPAVDGAITETVIKDGKVTYIKTVGDCAPAGFCGSGLISAAAQLLENGFIAPGGEPAAVFPDFGGIKLLPEDIAELQLAKSAVLSGINTLLHEAGMNAFEIARFVPAGSFGAGLDIGAAVKIGMLPDHFARICGKNAVSACGGASLLALNAENIAESEEIAKRIRITELADSQFFADEFISNMYFPYRDPGY